MKYIYAIATLSFWLFVMVLWVTHFWSAELDHTIPLNQVATYSLNDVSKHDQLVDCWMVIHEQVYDLTTYLPKHPTTLKVILPFCGKEASHAYDTKNRGKPHSSEASELLGKYRVGVLKHY